MIKKISKRFESQPRKIFLLDGFGALISAILLGVVLVKFNQFFGIPKSTLYILAAIPILFGIYDFYVFKRNFKKLGPYIRGIAILNLAYCLVSILLAIYHKDDIQFWGWYYIVSEVLIILIIVFIEFSVAKNV